MTKKKREQQKKETSSLKKIGYILLFALPLFVLIYFNRQNRQEKLKNDSFITYGIIES